MRKFYYIFFLCWWSCYDLQDKIKRIHIVCQGGTPTPIFYMSSFLPTNLPAFLSKSGGCGHGCQHPLAPSASGWWVWWPFSVWVRTTSAPALPAWWTLSGLADRQTDTYVASCFVWRRFIDHTVSSVSSLRSFEQQTDEGFVTLTVTFVTHMNGQSDYLHAV